MRHAAARPQPQHAQSKAGPQPARRPVGQWPAGAAGHTCWGLMAEPPPGWRPGVCRAGASLQRLCAWWARLGPPPPRGWAGRGPLRQGRAAAWARSSPRCHSSGCGPSRLGRARGVAGNNPPPQVSRMSNGPAPPQEPAKEPCGAEKGKTQHKRQGERLKAARAAGRRAQADGAVGRAAGRWVAVTPRAAAGGSGGSGPGRRGARPARGSCQASRSGHLSPCA